MGTNKLSGETVEVGDLLLDVAKLNKAFRIRLGSGGIALSASSGNSLAASIYGVLPTQALVYDAYLNVLVASTGATKTLSIGTSGTLTGFINGLSVASSGISNPVCAAGTSAALSTYGSFLTAFSSTGAQAEKTYATDSNASRTLFATPNSTDWVAFSADLYIFYTDLTR